MKKILLTTLLTGVLLNGFASDEKICVVTNQGNDGVACTPSELANEMGQILPCTQLEFRFTSIIPLDIHLLPFMNGM